MSSSGPASDSTHEPQPFRMEQPQVIPPPTQRRRLLANIIEPSLRAILFKLFPDNEPVVRATSMKERKKERNMSEIVQMVVQWTRLQEVTFELLPDGNTQFVELTPEEAAKFIGMTKRSL